MTIGENGELSTIEGHTWKSDALSTKEVTIPKVDGYTVTSSDSKSTTLASQLFSPTKELVLTVTYEK
ncbi:hypothetical protein [Streptococcus catagoni]|uniref:hypothetical protein n=1 Tax=Streptococcus catagoni TaxID=2654874 RepID=UPI001409CB7B|nr:hypothetical protein [Streptococcus catagoni]